MDETARGGLDEPYVCLACGERFPFRRIVGTDDGEMHCPECWNADGLVPVMEAAMSEKDDREPPEPSEQRTVHLLFVETSDQYDRVELAGAFSTEEKALSAQGAIIRHRSFVRSEPLDPPMLERGWWQRWNR